MAVTTNTQIISDGTKKTVILFTANFTTIGSDESAVTKIQGKNLSGALAVDTNNAVTVANGGTPRTNYNYAITRIISDVNIPNGAVTIKFDGVVPAPIWICGPGKGDNNIEEQLGSIWNAAQGPNGNVTFTTANTIAGSSYTILLELKKGPNSSNLSCDFSMGQIAAPADHNFGKYAVKP